MNTSTMNISTIRGSFFYLIITFTIPLCFLKEARAQDGDYVQINAFSPFYCRYLANGKTEIAEKSPSGKYKKLSFDKAREKSGKTKGELRNYQKKLAAIKLKLEKQRLEIEFGPGELSEKDKKLILNYANGFPDENDLDVSDIRDTIAGLGEWLNRLQIRLEFQNLERNQIKDCEKRKLPPLNSIPITYEVLITEDKSRSDPWYALGVVLMKYPVVLMPGYGGNFVCLTFQSGLKRFVAFNSDPVGGQDSLYSFASNHPLVLAGETARLLERDSQNRVTEYGYAPSLFSKTGGRSSRASAEDFAKSQLAKQMETWGSSAQAKRPTFNKKLNKYECPE